MVQVILSDFLNGVAAKRIAKVKGVVIHNDYGSMTPEAYIDWLKERQAKGELEKGFAHYYINKNTIARVEGLEYVAWHTANDDGNANYIGYEVCQSYYGSISDSEFILNEDMVLRQAAEDLQLYGLQADQNTVRLHNEFSSTSCPHRSWDIHVGKNTDYNSENKAKLKDNFIKRIRKYMTLGKTVAEMLKNETDGTLPDTGGDPVDPPVVVPPVEPPAPVIPPFEVEPKPPTPEELYKWTPQSTKPMYSLGYDDDNITNFIDLTSYVDVTDYDGKKRRIVFGAEKLKTEEKEIENRFNPLNYNLDIRLKLIVFELPQYSEGNKGEVSIGPIKGNAETKKRHKYKINQFKTSDVDDLNLIISSQPQYLKYSKSISAILPNDGFNYIQYNGELIETVISVKPKSFVKLKNGKTKIIYDDAVSADIQVNSKKTERVNLNLGSWLSDMEVNVPAVTGYVDTQLFDNFGLMIPLKSRLQYELTEQDVLGNTSTFTVTAGFVPKNNDSRYVENLKYALKTNNLFEINDSVSLIPIYKGSSDRFIQYYSGSHKLKHNSLGELNNLTFNLKGLADTIAPFDNLIYLKKGTIPRIKQKSTITFNEVLGINGTKSKIPIKSENNDYSYRWDMRYDRDAAKGRPFTAEYFEGNSPKGAPVWLPSGRLWGSMNGELEPKTKEFPMRFTSEQMSLIKYQFKIDGGHNSLSNWKDSDYGYMRLSLETLDEGGTSLGFSYSYWKVVRPEASKVGSNLGLVTTNDPKLSVGINESAGNKDDYTYDVVVKDDKGKVIASQTGVKSSDLNNGKFDFDMQGPLKDNILSSYPNSNLGNLTVDVTTKNDGSTVGKDTGNIKVEIVNLDLTILKPTGLKYLDTNLATVGLTKDSSVVIQGSSDLKVTIEANTFKLAKGSSSSGYLITFGSAIREITSNFTSEYTFTFTKDEIKDISQDTELTIVATDSRGSTAKISKTIKVIPYIKPTIYPKISLISNFNSGVYADVTVRISRLNDLNVLNGLIVRYKQNILTENWVNLGALEFTESSRTSEYILYKSTRIKLNDVDLNTSDYYFEYSVDDNLNETIEVKLEGKRTQIATLDSEKGSLGLGRQPKLDSSLALNTLEIGDFGIFRKTESGVAFEGTLSLGGLDLLAEINELKSRLSVLEK